jgi:hypothetical protein
MLRGEKVGGSQFHSLWLTYKVDLPKQINYMPVDRNVKINIK